MAIQLTKDQHTAVYDRGGSLLVSAAAGSGKTKVLVERLFAYMEQNHCHVDDFLIITYTKAAAAELRSKIASELSKRVAAHPEDQHLRRQMFRVYQADIKTVDAFCAGLLRENIHLLHHETGSLTPDFRVLDEQEALVLKERVLNQVMEAFYQRVEQQDAKALQLAETLGAGRDDRKLQQLVLDVHTKIQSHPHPLQWLKKVEENWSVLPQDLAASPYGEVIIADTLRRAAFWHQQLMDTVKWLEECEPVHAAYSPAFLLVAEQLRQYASAAQLGWDALSAIQLDFPKLKAAKGEDLEYYKVRAKTIWERCKKDLKQMSAVYRVSEAEHLQDLSYMAPAMQALTELTADFSNAYQAEKVRRNCMDFSDQEHYAIDILLNEDHTPTELAQQISARYVEIMVDEYQDTNEVQNCIFAAISREGNNLFTVGDVKQSIYRFRLADPGIFLEKYQTYQTAEQAKEREARKVLLSRNFRSRQSILASTNFVFRNIMSPQMGEMKYGQDEQLNFGAEYFQSREDVDTEFHLISVANTEEEVFDRTRMEARFIASRIRQMLASKYPVQDDDGQFRPIKAEDIVILMRSPSGRLKTFTEALQQENIPCSSAEGGDYFATMEIAVAFSFLQIIDNPHQDVPLISVLRSPLFGFTPDRLAQVRAGQTTADFYTALCLDESEDTQQFLQILEELRESARDLPVDRLTWLMYSRCNMLGVFGAMHGGEERKNHLLAFYAYAQQMVSGGKSSLFDFVTHLRSTLEQGKQPPISARQSAGGVQIMSIHKSKGLEFPVVFLCDLQKEFNDTDYNKTVLVHPALGFGTECVDIERRIHYKTVSKTAVSMAMEREAKAEEMRILYVAMTRAKEKLIMVDCMKYARKHIKNLISVTSCPVEPEAVGAAKSLGDWILLPLLNTAEASEIYRWADMRPASITAEDCHMTVYLWENPTPETQALHGDADQQKEKQLVSPEVLESIYPHQAACAIPTKVTATQLKGREIDQEIAEGTMAAHLPLSFEKPRFMQSEHGLSAAERGTAMHLVMQFLDFAESSELQVEQRVRELQQRHLLTPEQAEAIDCKKIAAFLQSPLAQRICSSDKVYREYRFALLMPADIYNSEVSDEKMMLQGVVDCAFETPEGLVIVDFKTDHIRVGEEEERAELYRAQLDAYAAALERVLERPVTEKILYFFATNSSINL